MSGTMNEVESESKSGNSQQKVEWSMIGEG